MSRLRVKSHKRKRGPDDEEFRTDDLHENLQQFDNKVRKISIEPVLDETILVKTLSTFVSKGLINLFVCSFRDEKRRYMKTLY